VFKKRYPFYFLNNSVRCQPISIKFGVQHLATKLFCSSGHKPMTIHLVKFASLTPAAYSMPVLPYVHILNGKNISWLCMYGKL